MKAFSINGRSSTSTLKHKTKPVLTFESSANLVDVCSDLFDAFPAVAYFDPTLLESFVIGTLLPQKTPLPSRCPFDAFNLSEKKEVAITPPPSKCWKCFKNVFADDGASCRVCHRTFHDHHTPDATWFYPPSQQRFYICFDCKRIQRLPLLCILSLELTNKKVTPDKRKIKLALADDSLTWVGHDSPLQLIRSNTNTKNETFIGPIEYETSKTGWTIFEVDSSSHVILPAAATYKILYDEKDFSVGQHLYFLPGSNETLIKQQQTSTKKPFQIDSISPWFRTNSVPPVHNSVPSTSLGAIYFCGLEWHQIRADETLFRSFQDCMAEAKTEGNPSKIEAKTKIYFYTDDTRKNVYAYLTWNFKTELLTHSRSDNSLFRIVLPEDAQEKRMVCVIDTVYVRTLLREEAPQPSFEAHLLHAAMTELSNTSFVNFEGFELHPSFNPRIARDIAKECNFHEYSVSHGTSKLLRDRVMFRNGWKKKEKRLT